MAGELPEGTVTVLFTDVVGSTDLTTSRGDEAAQEILRGQRDLVRQQVEEHSGHEVKGLGDGFMVAFGSARKAVACAVGIQRALEEHNRGQPLDEQVLIRIGLNTGEVIQEEADLFGETVNAAARIAAKAKGGQILVSEMVKGLLGRSPDVELVDRGRFRLKGFPERWRLFEVIWQEEAATAPTLVERTPFVGREAERGELRRCLDQLAGGRGGLVMIGGEPGVGKTRIAEELMAEASQRGITAFTGHCYEMEGAPPYIPFLEILQAAARVVPPEDLREALGDSAPEVAKLMPELRRMFPDIASPLELRAEQERFFMFNGVLVFMGRAARARPLLLTLEDLHWADEPTLLLLQHMAQRLREMPVLIVGTYRDVELDVDRPLAAILEELLRQRLAHRLALKRLPKASVSAMLQALSGQEPPATLVQAIYSETEGNPFFVEEVFQHLAEEGKLFDAKGRWRPDLEVSELDVPEGVRLVIGRRLRRVSEECRRVLTTAAMIGRAFSFDLLEALADADTDALLDAIDDAERTQLIASVSDTPGRAGARPGEASFTFAHELIRQTLISGLSLPRRQRLHLRVAEAMEQVYSQTLDERAADLAHHLYQAGTASDPEKTVRYLTLAGKQAQRAAAFEDALRHFESALSLNEGRDRQKRADLLYQRGLALRSLDRWEGASSALREALSAHEEVGDAEMVGRICWEIADLLDWHQRWDEALETSLRGLAAVGNEASPYRCRLLAQAGAIQSLIGEYSSGDDMVTEALDMAEGLGDSGLLGETLMYQAVHMISHHQHRESAEASLRSADLLRSANVWDSAAVLSFAQVNLFYLGRFDEVAAIGEELEPLAIRLGHRGALLFARRYRAYRDLMLTGDIDGAERFAEAEIESYLASGVAWVSGSYSFRGAARFWRGRWEQALEDIQEADSLEPDDFSAGNALGALFSAMAHIGSRGAALTMLKEKRSGLPRLGRTNTQGSWEMLAGVIEGLAVLGERRELATLYPVILELRDMGTIIASFRFRLISALAGMAAACGQRWDEAGEHYEKALRQAHELPIVIEQPEVRRWYARMLIDRNAPGDRAKARELLTEAIAMYRKIGMPKHVEMAEALLREV